MPRYAEWHTGEWSARNNSDIYAWKCYTYRTTGIPDSLSKSGRGRTSLHLCYIRIHRKSEVHSPFQHLFLPEPSGYSLYNKVLPYRNVLHNRIASPDYIACTPRTLTSGYVPTSHFRAIACSGPLCQRASHPPNSNLPPDAEKIHLPVQRSVLRTERQFCLQALQRIVSSRKETCTDSGGHLVGIVYVGVQITIPIVTDITLHPISRWNTDEKRLDILVFKCNSTGVPANYLPKQQQR